MQNCSLWDAVLGGEATGIETPTGYAHLRGPLRTPPTGYIYGHGKLPFYTESDHCSIFFVCLQGQQWLSRVQGREAAVFSASATCELFSGICWKRNLQAGQDVSAKTPPLRVASLLH